MKLNTKANLAMALFMGACLVPSAGMLVIPEHAAAGNQTLAPPPSLTTGEGRPNPELFQEITDYTAGHFALRQEMITACAVLEGSVFHTSPEESVLLGQSGWLFYKETLDGYLHTAPMTGRQLYGAARTLALLTEYAGARGARLVFTVAPNKASLYPQYLPYVGAPLEGEDDIGRLRPLLEAQGVEYIDLFAPFRAENEVLYFKTDSHWNTQGAALAQKTLLDALGKEYPPFWLEKGRAVPDSHRGDLYEMVYPTGTGLDWDVEFDRPFTFSCVRPVRSPEDQRIETENPAKTGSLLMFRDSFGNSLYPFMAEEFGHGVFSRSMPYQMSLLEQTGADTVVIEIVERNLDWLATRAPVFPAPERGISGEPAQGTASARVARVDGSELEGSLRLEGYSRLEGTLSGPVDAGSPVYVQAGGRLYEATPAGEGENPFTLYLPQGTDLGGLRVLYLQNGAVCRADHVDFI